MIQTFSYYNQKPQSLFDAENTVISKSALERIMLSSSEYCFILPRTNKLHECIDSFRREKLGVYIIAGISKGQKFRSIFVTKKPNLLSEEFRSTINRICQSNRCDAVYSNSIQSKILKEGKVQEIDRKVNISLYEEFLRERQGKSTVFGIEIPLNEDTEAKFRKAGIMFYPVSEQDFQYAKPWKQLLSR